jgi:hypothetical protein
VKRPLVSLPLKILLIPIAILAFLIFLIVLGAIGLGVAFIILATLGKIWRLIAGAGRGVGKAGRRVSRRGRGQQI